MAILCLSSGLDDLKKRLGSILLGYSYLQKPVYVRDLGFQGALTALLLHAIKPNLVQTTEHTPAFVHGGPFANIAHGCNSVMATKTALALGDYVVTEAGFGADLGAEKFFDIKCRQAGLQPAVCVLVATTQALKLHGGCDEKLIQQPNREALINGFLNLERHLQILRGFGQKVVIAFNRFHFDTEEEILLVRDWCEERNAPFALCEGFTKGGDGATELASIVLKTIEEGESSLLQFAYNLEDDIPTKLLKVVQKVYGGNAIKFTSTALQQLRKLEKEGFGNLPVCIAKTQYSFSDDASRVGVATDFTLTFNQLLVNAGAGFIVAVAGDIMRMPGLPKQPAALGIDVIDGKIVGLS
jgi:formate--tetrahydrofolate ligase